MLSSGLNGDFQFCLKTRNIGYVCHSHLLRAEDQAWRPVALFGGLTNEYGYLWNGTERLTNGQKLTLSQFNLVYETQQTFNE